MRLFAIRVTSRSITAPGTRKLYNGRYGFGWSLNQMQALKARNWSIVGSGGKMRKNRLVLQARPDEKFILFDEISGLTTVVKPFYRDNGNLMMTFEAPSTVRISRERQRSVPNANS